MGIGGGTQSAALNIVPDTAYLFTTAADGTGPHYVYMNDPQFTTTGSVEVSIIPSVVGGLFWDIRVSLSGGCNLEFMLEASLDAGSTWRDASILYTEVTQAALYTYLLPLSYTVGYIGNLSNLRLRLKMEFVNGGSGQAEPFDVYTAPNRDNYRWLAGWTGSATMLEA